MYRIMNALTGERSKTTFGTVVDAHMMITNIQELGLDVPFYILDQDGDIVDFMPTLKGHLGEIEQYDLN